MTVVIQPPIPVGVMHQYGGATAPTGYLLCDGTAVSRTTYASLYATISTTYGVGDGSTTFNLPDLRGRLPMGAGTGTGLNASGTGAPTGSAQTARTRGAWGGEETHLLSGAESGTSAHSHTATSAAHNHSAIATAGGGGGATVASWTVGGAGAGNATTFGTTGTTAATITVANSTAANASSRHAVISPFVVLNYIIKC